MTFLIALLSVLQEVVHSEWDLNDSGNSSRTRALLWTSVLYWA
jgi:hypothetical protein